MRKTCPTWRDISLTGILVIWKILFSFCVYMIKRTVSLTEILPLKSEISVSGMNRNPCKHFSLPTEMRFNRGAHAYDIRIQLIMASVRLITRHH